MAEPAPLGPRRLWRAVIRPLVAEGTGNVVCDVADAAIPEGLLVTTRATLHAVGASSSSAVLAQVYRDRVVFHRSPAAAWETVGPCRLAVLDAARNLSAHIDALDELAGSDAPAPPVLVQGFGREGGERSLTAFSRRGWVLVELPGFDQIRLVLPGGPRALGSTSLEAILERLQAGPEAPTQTYGGAVADERLLELEQRLGELEERAARAEAARELAERRRAATEDVNTTLRRFRDEARADAGRAREQAEDMRRLLETARADTAAARTRVAHLALDPGEPRDDLVRLQGSHAWRLGHWLTRAARVLTFRKPGRTDAVGKALERLDSITPSGDAHR